MGSPPVNREFGAIEWIKFEVELKFPVGAGVAASARSSRSKLGIGIRRIDLPAFLKSRYFDIRPDLKDLDEVCAGGQPRIQNVTLEYGDLGGDGREEALYEGFTCYSGTGGADFFGVLKLKPDGKLVALRIAPTPKVFKGRNPEQNLRLPKQRHAIQNGRLGVIYPVYKNEDECYTCATGGERQFVHRWDGHQFALDDIIDVPQERVQHQS